MNTKQEMDELEKTFNYMANQPDCGIIDPDNATNHKESCERYATLCNKAGESTDNCTAYCKVLARCNEVISQDEESASYWTCPECGNSNRFGRRGTVECTECGCTNPDCV